MEGTAVGYRFYPTEEELVSFYLHKKLDQNESNLDRVIPLLDIYAFQPWQLPELSGEVCRGDPEQWFFFVPRQEKEARGEKPSRTTASGYWKATGSPCYVHSSSGKVIGVKKSMVFYSGKAPSGIKSKWKMHEYRAIKQDLPTSIPRLRHELSLCRIYVVSGSFGTFDRRPMAPETSSRRDNMVVKIDEKNDDEFSVSAYKNATAMLMEEISCSSETSLSEVNQQSVVWKMEESS